MIEKLLSCQPALPYFFSLQHRNELFYFSFSKKKKQGTKNLLAAGKNVSESFSDHG